MGGEGRERMGRVFVLCRRIVADRQWVWIAPDYLPQSDH